MTATRWCSRSGPSRPPPPRDIRALPYDADSWQISPSMASRLAAAGDAVTAVRPLADLWNRVARGALPASEIAKHLADHDLATFAATRDGTAGRYADALKGLGSARAELTAALDIRDKLVETVDTTTLDLWVERNRTYDDALARLYQTLRDANGRVTQAARDGLRRRPTGPEAAATRHARDGRHHERPGAGWPEPGRHPHRGGPGSAQRGTGGGRLGARSPRRRPASSTSSRPCAIAMPSDAGHHPPPTWSPTDRCRPTSRTASHGMSRPTSSSCPSAPTPRRTPTWPSWTVASMARWPPTARSVSRSARPMRRRSSRAARWARHG